jgi:hypothetical protein
MFAALSFRRSAPSVASLLALLAVPAAGCTKPNVDTTNASATVESQPTRLVATPRLSADLSRGRVAVHAFAADVGLTSTAFGRDDQQVALAAASTRTVGERVDFTRAGAGLTEWWRSTPQGLEQGFDVATPPAGHGPLRITVAVDGALHPTVAGRDVVLADANDAARVSIRGLRANDANGRGLRAWFTAAGSAIDIHVDDRSAAYPITIDPVVGTETELYPADLNDDSSFGSSVSLSGTRILVGATGELGGTVTSGAAYVFDKDSKGVWSQSAKFWGTDGVVSDEEGAAVKLVGDTAFVSATMRPGSGLTEVGAVYVFTRDSTGKWTQSQQILPPTAKDQMHFGAALAYAGNLLFISASDESFGTTATPISAAGAVYVYAKGTSGWAFQTKVSPATPLDSDRFGISLAASVQGTTITLAAGAPGHQTGGYSNTGAVWLFTRSTTSTGAWTELTPLAPTDFSKGDEFGWSVSMDVTSGTTPVQQLLVGAPSHNAATTYTGALYLYAYDTTKSKWSLASEILATDAQNTDELGESVSLANGIVAASAYNYSPSSTLISTGKLYVFTPSGTTWSQHTILATDGANDDQMGNSIDFDGTTIVAGASRRSSTTHTYDGQTYVFSPATGLALGGTCANAADCASGFCTDGICCDSTCDGQCNACDSTGHCKALDGAPPAAGKPACTFPAKLCEKGACGTTCAADTDCASGASCNASKQCVALSSVGGKCAHDTDCGTGHCVDAVCCVTACTGTCEACDVTGSVGTCTAVSGPPHGTRACTGGGSSDPLCGATCDGNDNTKCNFPTATTPCVKQSCSGSQVTDQGTCNGSGTCSATPHECPGNLKCGTTGSCLASCTSDADCIAQSSCISGSCTAPKVAQCSADHASSTNNLGAVTQCAPYVCNDVTGLCNSDCKGSGACAVGSVCDTSSNKCVASAGGGGSSGGCDVSATSRTGAAWPIAVALVLGALRRRRR